MTPWASRNWCCGSASPDGNWANLPYAPRSAAGEPSRTIVLLAEGSERLVLVHSVYGIDGSQPRRDGIAWQAADRRRIDLSATATPLLEAATRLNDATGTKARLPAGQPWIVLASDEQGNVVEAHLPERD